jgi:hypothetical protein
MKSSIESVAKVRNQHVAQLLIEGQLKYLLFDETPCSLDKLAQSLNTDMYEKYVSGDCRVEILGRSAGEIVGSFVEDWTQCTLSFSPRVNLTRRHKRILKYLESGCSIRCHRSSFVASVFSPDGNTVIDRVRYDTIRKLEGEGMISSDREYSEVYNIPGDTIWIAKERT